MASSSSASVLRLARLGVMQGLRSQQQAAAAASASTSCARLLSSEAAKPAGPPPPGGDEPAKKASNVIQYVLWGGLLGGGAFAYTLFTSDLKQQPALGTAPAKPAAVVKDYGAVRKAIADVLDAPDYDDGSYGPVLVRLAWHSSGTYDKTSGTGGSNGGTIRFEPECAYAANAGLAVARGVLEPIKQKFPWITYADLYTLAGVVAVEEMGGPVVPWSPGRTDEPDGSHCTPDGRLPDASKGAQHIRDIFYRMGFDDREIVALSGAHALGRCHTNRSGYDNPWTNAPTTFSNLYFTELLTNKWTKRKWSGPLQYEDKSKHLMMLPTDMALTSDRKFRKYVELYGKDQDKFFEDFAAAFGKLLALGVPPPATAAA